MSLFSGKDQNLSRQATLIIDGLVFLTTNVFCFDDGHHHFLKFQGCAQSLIRLNGHHVYLKGVEINVPGLENWGYRSKRHNDCVESRSWGGNNPGEERPVVGLVPLEIWS